MKQPTEAEQPPEMEQPTELVIIDGHGLLFRMFYGIPAQLRSKDGLPLNAAIGFTGTVLKYIEQFDPQRMLVVFDNEQPSFRSGLYPEYKLNRMVDYDELDDDENPFAQFKVIEDSLDALGIKHATHVGFEADDAMASYERLAGNMATVVISNDTDLLQLVNESTDVYADRGKKSIAYNVDTVISRFGVAPHSMVDFKAITGDSSDNIPGLFGVGPKTAAKLIAQYGDIECIVQQEASITPAKLREKIAANHDLLLRNKQLITLRRDVPLGFKLSDLTVDGPQYGGLRAIDVLASTGYL